MNKIVHRALAVFGLSVIGFLSLGVVPPEELEATKPQLEVTQSGNNLIIDWAAHPEVFYFMEGTPDLMSGTWVTAKLLKDNDANGTLTLGTAISGSKGFYRLSLEGDPNSARMRADDDGDKIINLLEVLKGMDAFSPEDPTDSDSDDIPDYFERAHFDTLDHDGTYVAVAGGLTLAEAYANATDPNKIDSDGDGWTDAQEIAWGWDPNYDQSRDDPNYGPDGDLDGDGLTNLQELKLGLDPTTSDNPGIVQEAIKNGDFDEPDIGTGLEGGTKWDYWAGIPGWEPHVGTNIEIQKKFYNDPYCELEAETAGHTGIKQIVGTKEGQAYLLMFDYATRPDVSAAKSNFDLEFDGNTLEIRHSAHLGWKTEVVAFEAKDVITRIAFIPTGNGDTTGGFIDKVKLLKVDLVPHWPSSIFRGLGPTDAPGYPEEVVDRNNVDLLVNNDNDDRDTITADPSSSNYPQDHSDDSGVSILKNQSGMRDDDAIMVRIKFPGAENINSGTLELRTGQSSGIDPRIALYHAVSYTSDGTLLEPGQFSVDLANPDTTNPLSALAEGEEVKIFIEGVDALGDIDSIEVGLYLTMNGNETKLSDFTLKLHKTESKIMRFVAHSSVGSSANSWTKDRMQDSSNAIRKDDDHEANNDRMVPIDFRRRQTISISNGDGITSSTQSRDNFNEAKIIDVLRLNNAQCYVIDQITNAGGWSIEDSGGTPLGMIVVPHREGNSSGDGPNTDKIVIAHEWLHAFADEHHQNIEHNLMWGTGPYPIGVTRDSQMVNRGDSDEVTEDQKNSFMNNHSIPAGEQ